MGKIVGAFGTGHILMTRNSAGERGERVFEGMREVGRRVRALNPDVIVIVTSDHMYNFDLSLQVPFIVGVADSYQPFGDMGLPTDRFPGHRAFAEGFVRHAAEEGFDLAKTEEVKPDHGTTLPNLLANPDLTVPVVPLFVNTAMDPVPAAGRCWALGGVLKAHVEQRRPAEERVVIMGTGGLSHWLGMARQGDVNEAFDNAVLDALSSGRATDLCSWSGEHILEHGGNGGLEILNWILMAGSVPGATGERVYYEPVPEWLTGMGGIEMRLGA